MANSLVPKCRFPRLVTVPVQFAAIKGFSNVDLDSLIFGDSEVDHQESYVVLLSDSFWMF